MIRESVQVERSFESVAPASPAAIPIPIPVPVGSGSGSESGSSSSSSSSSDNESDHEHSEEHSTHSAELQIQTISTHLLEERLTEAEKNERLQKKLMVSSGLEAPISSCSTSSSFSPSSLSSSFLFGAPAV